jgi:hypothetical protein
MDKRVNVSKKQIHDQNFKGLGNLEFRHPYFERAHGITIRHKLIIHSTGMTAEDSIQFDL